MYLTFSKIRLV